METQNLKGNPSIEIQGENRKTGITSIDKPYLKDMPEIEYDETASQKTAYQFILDESKKSGPHYRDLPALNFYGKRISNGTFFDLCNKTGVAFRNIGIGTDDVVAVFSLNIPETYYVMYGLNAIGVATEWFNPLVMSDESLKEHIKKTNTNYIVAIDVMYPIITQAIRDTNVKKVIMLSALDSFPVYMKLAYRLRTWGLYFLTTSKFFQFVFHRPVKAMHNERSHEKVKLNRIERLAQNVLKFSEKDKIIEKVSLYRDTNRDERIIVWRVFLEKYGQTDSLSCSEYDPNKTKFIVHTGGTTGPAKPIAHTDYAINSGVYQIAITPLGISKGETFCQLIPPMVAYSLESMHFARYMQMETHLIATYDRNEFPKIVKKTKANHYTTVPSFVKTLVENEKAQHQDYSFVKSMQYGGEGIAPEVDAAVNNLIDDCGRLGFGANEAFGIFTGNYKKPGIMKKYSSCGFPMIGNGYIIVDVETNAELPYGNESSRRNFS